MCNRKGDVLMADGRRFNQLRREAEPRWGHRSPYDYTTSRVAYLAACLIQGRRVRGNGTELLTVAGGKPLGKKAHG